MPVERGRRSPLVAVGFMVLGRRSAPLGDRLRGLGLHRLGLRVWWIAFLMTRLTSVAVVLGDWPISCRPPSGLQSGSA